MEDAPFIFYEDLESDNKELEEKPKDKDKKTIKIYEQKANSYGYVLIQKDSKIIMILDVWLIQLQKNGKIWRKISK